MKSLKDILEESTLNLDNTQKAIIVYMKVAPTPKMSYGIVTGARNSVSARESLESSGYVVIDDERKEASLTPRGVNVLTSENLIDDMGEVTERGQNLIDRYIIDKQEWTRFESFKYLP
jgi:hypothetical protein